MGLSSNSHYSSRMLKTSASFVLASKASTTSPRGEQAVLAAWGGRVRRGTPPVLPSALALLDGRFEHPTRTSSHVLDVPSIEGPLR
jgi:hypothetical protein